jgi:hypothetical protein
MRVEFLLRPHRRPTLTVPAVVVLVLMLGACSGEVRPEVAAGIDACASCNMVIDTLNQACGYVAGGEFVTFDSPACLLRSHDDFRRRGVEPPSEIYFADYESGEFVPAKTTVFLLTGHLPTVMGAGVLCFATAQGTEAVRSAADEEITDWTGYRRLKGQPDTIVEAAITPTGLSPEIIEVAKGELVLFKIHGGELTEKTTLTVRGYPEIGDVVIEPSGKPTELRFFATRPGMGFPVVGADEQALGMLRVTGAHTADEEAL